MSRPARSLVSTAGDDRVSGSLARVRRKPALLVALAALVVAPAAALLLRERNRSPRGDERIAVALADVVNETGERDLDAVSGLLISSLEQSRRLSILTRSRMLDVLKQLGRPIPGRIDESVGREVCRRANVSALLVLTVRKFDQVYSLDLKALDPLRDAYLFAFKEEGAGKSNVPRLIDRLSERSRALLREKAVEIQGARLRVEELTSNLEAYQHYFLGQQLVDLLRFKEARAEFREAIRLDSDFTLAHYRLAYVDLWTQQEPAEVKESTAKALAHLARAPEKERLMIEAQAAHLAGRLDQCVALLHQLLDKYPNEKEVLFVAGDIAYHRQRYAEAARYLRRVLAIDPAFSRALQHLSWTYSATHERLAQLEIARQYVARAPGDIDGYLQVAQASAALEQFQQAEEALHEARQRFPESPAPIRDLGWLRIAQLDFDGAERELGALAAPSRPPRDRIDGEMYLARLAVYGGRIRDAQAYADRALEVARKQNVLGDVGAIELEKALWTARRSPDAAAALLGQTELRKRVPELRHALFAHDVNYFVLALELGAFDRAEQALAARRATDLPFAELLIKAFAHRQRGACDPAVIAFEAAVRAFPSHAALFGADFAECYARIGDREGALALLRAVQTATLDPWKTGFSLHALALPRALLLRATLAEEVEQTDQAAETYDQLLSLWSEADEDLPDLALAEARRARLGHVVKK